MPVYRVPVAIVHPSITGPAVNTWHVRTQGNPTDPDDGDLNSMVTAIKQFYTDCLDLFASGATFTYAGEAITTGNTPQISHSAPAWSLTGTNTSKPLPPANSICITWRSTSATRSGRGRTFLSPFTVDAGATDGRIQGSWLSTIRAAGASLIETSDTVDNGAVVVYSQKTGLALDFITSTVTNRFSVLRSRRD